MSFKGKYTARQYKLAEIWVNNELNDSGLSMAEMVKAAGYPLNQYTHNAKRTITKEGTQTAIAEISETMKGALEKKGVGPEYLANKIHEMLEGRFSKEVNFRAINHGLEHALKIGVGGGYKPEETRSINVNVSAADLKKYAPLRDEYEEKMRRVELGLDEK